MKNLKMPYLYCVVVLLVTLVLSIGIGSVSIPPASTIRLLVNSMTGLGNVADIPASLSDILLKIRLPHAFLILMTGAALAGSGAAYQGLFRNPLADPFLIGVASGAGLGAVIAMAISWPSNMLGMYSIPISAFCGAILTVFVVYQLSRVGKHVPMTSLILAGVAISSFANALTSLLMLKSDEEVHRALSWLLGGGTVTGWQPVLAMIPYLVIGISCLVYSGHSLNVLQFGEEQAQQLGLSTNRVKMIVILAASLTTATAVAFAGIIGFVGLIVPHLIRIIWGTDYRHLIGLSFLGGGSVLLIADLLARTSFAPQVLPVGIVTALAGAPFFLWILRRFKSEGS